MGEKFKEKHPKLAAFIAEKLPSAGDLIGSALPDKGLLGVLKNIISKDNTLSPEDKALADKLFIDAMTLENANTADARAHDVSIQTSENVPKIVKIRSTIIAFLVSLVWSVMTVYIIGSMLNIIKREPTTNFEAIMAMYSGLCIQFGTILNFDFGSSIGSHNKQKQLDKK